MYCNISHAIELFYKCQCRNTLVPLLLAWLLIILFHLRILFSLELRKRKRDRANNKHILLLTLQFPIMLTTSKYSANIHDIGFFGGHIFHFSLN